MSDYAISAEITANSKGFTENINSCGKSLNNFSKSFDNATKKISSGLSEWGIDFGKFYNTGSGFFKKFGLDLDKFAGKLGLSGPLVAGITTTTVALTKLGQEMNSAVAEIAKGTGATGESLKGLEQSFKNVLTGGVQASMQEVGVMIAEINTRFGSTGKELENLSEQFDMFSTITGVNTKEAIDGVADVMAKWNIKNKDTKKLLDQLAKAGQDSGISINTLMNSLKQGRTVFSQFGMSATTSIAFLESLAKAGIDTESAMQGMKYALAKFSKEGRNAQEAFKEVSDAIKNASNDSEALSIAIENFGTKAGPEMINVFRNGTESIEAFEEALKNAGGTLEETEANTRTSKEAWKELVDSIKSMFGGLGQGLDNLFRDIIDSITAIVRQLSPIIQPIANIIGEVFSTVGFAVKTLINNIIYFKDNYTQTWNYITKITQSVYVIFHKILGNLQDIFSNVFGFIFAILDKKWALAWEYAKNSFLKFVDIFATSLSELIKLVSPAINKIIQGLNKFVDIYNWIQKKLGKETFDGFGLIGDDFDISQMSGLTKAIENSNKKIDELTGKTSQKLIGTLGEVQNVATEVTATITSTIENSTDSISAWDDKLRNQMIQRLENEKNNAIIRAENEEKSEAEIFKIKQDYDYKIRALKEEGIRKEMKAELEKAKTTEESAKIEMYYLNEISKLYEEQEQKITKAKQQRSQWDSKLLSQNISFLEAEENERIKIAENEKKSEAEIYKLKHDYGVRIIELKKQQLESQREADLENVTDSEEIAKINLYYQAEITKMIVDENAKRKQSFKNESEAEKEISKKGFKDIIDEVKGYAKKIGEVFKSIGKTIKKVFDTITKLASSAVKGLVSGFNFLKGVFDKLINFNPTETLTSLLEYEDKVLTFFTFISKEIPGFVESALSSISILMDKLFEQIDFNEIADIVQKVIESIAKYAPKIVNQISTLVTGLIQTIANVLFNNVDVITNTVGSVITSVANALPTLLGLLIKGILTGIKSIATAINNNSDQLINDFVEIIKSIVQALVDFVSNDGWKSLLNAIVNIIKAINKSIVDNLPALIDGVIKMLPDLINSLIAIIVDASKVIPKIIKPVARLLVEAIKNLIPLLVSPEIIQSGIEAGISIFEAVITEIVPQLPKIVIQLVKGLIKAFASINWMSLVKDIFKAFINGIKSLFGIHSPSTLFQSFGSMMVQGLVNGLKNIWGNVSGIFSNLVGNIGNVFGNIGNIVSNAMSGLFNTVSSWVSSIGDKLGSIGSGISNVASKVGGAVSSGVSKVKSFFGFATGTPSAPSGLAVVGERGPELIDFKGGERVYNNSDSRKMLAGGNNTSNSFNITFNNTSQTSAFEMMKELKRYNRQLAFNGVL